MSAGHTLTRQDYTEPRFITAGRLRSRFVVLVCTPRGEVRRILSMRYGHEREDVSSTLTDPDDAPELDATFFAEAYVDEGDRLIRRAVGRPPLPVSERKQLVSLRLDQDVLERFRATGPGWQTRINEALRRVASELPCKAG